jgi:hypothetical protein
MTAFGPSRYFAALQNLVAIGAQLTWPDLRLLDLVANDPEQPLHGAQIGPQPPAMLEFLAIASPELGPYRAWRDVTLHGALPWNAS